MVAFTASGDQRLELATLGFSYECQAACRVPVVWGEWLERSKEFGNSLPWQYGLQCFDQQGNSARGAVFVVI